MKEGNNHMEESIWFEIESSKPLNDKLAYLVIKQKYISPIGS